MTCQKIEKTIKKEEEKKLEFDFYDTIEIVNKNSFLLYKNSNSKSS